MTISTQCLECKHYIAFSTCEAYPDKIPQDIFDGTVEHTEPYPGDNGIMFEARENVEITKGEKKVHVKGHSTKKVYVKEHYRTVKGGDDDEKPKKLFSMEERNLKSLISGTAAGLPPSVHDKNIYIAEFHTGKGIYKVVENEANAIGELGYYNLCKEIGWDMVPQTEKHDYGHGDGTCQSFVSGDEPWDGETGIKINEKHFNDLAQIFVMDVVTGNIDRHWQNVKINEDGRVWAIDNDLWTGNNDLYNSGDVENSFYSLSRAVRGQTISFGDDSMVYWLTSSLDQDEFSKFEVVVYEKLEKLLEYKDNIESFYDMENMLNEGAIKDHIKSAGEYLTEWKK